MLKYAIVFCAWLCKCYCDSNGKNDLVTHTVFGRILCNGKQIRAPHTVHGEFFNKTHHIWKTETRSFEEGSFVFQHSVPRNVLSDKQHMYLTLETTACNKTGNILTLKINASLNNDLDDLDFAMGDFLLHTVTGRIFCEGMPITKPHFIDGNFGNKTHRFWDARVRSYPNGTFIFEHFIPKYILSGKHSIYLTFRSSACSKHGRMVKFENETSAVTDLSKLDFMPKVSYRLTGKASCCEGIMPNKQLTIELLKPSSDNIVWSKIVSTNNQSQFNLEIRENIRDEKFDIKIKTSTCGELSMRVYKELTQEDTNFGTVKFYRIVNSWFPLLFARPGVNIC